MAGSIHSALLSALQAAPSAGPAELAARVQAPEVEVRAALASPPVAKAVRVEAGGIELRRQGGTNEPSQKAKAPAKPKLRRRLGAKATIRALVLEGPTNASEAAEAAGCSPSYARRIMRQLEAEGIVARPVVHKAFGARASVLRALLQLGGDTATAEGLAAVAGCGVKHVRKVLCALEATKAVASAEAGASLAVRIPGDLFSPDEWRIGEEAVALVEAELRALDAEAGQAEEEAKLSRLGAADTFAEAEATAEDCPF